MEGMTRHGDIYYPTDEARDERDDYRDLWDAEAEEDAVYSATGIVSHGREDYATLTKMRQPLWNDFPARHFRHILEVGCGYGRVPMLLSRERGVTCDRYTGVDVSRKMLDRFARYRREYGIFPSADLRLVCTSAERVPLPSASIDLVISSGVFLHMGKTYLRRTLETVGRVLEDSGAIVFDTSFPNTWSIALVPSRVFGWFAPTKPNRAKYYTYTELEALMRESGIAAKCGAIKIEPALFAIFPDRIRRTQVPLVASLNSLLTPPAARTPAVHGRDVQRLFGATSRR